MFALIRRRQTSRGSKSRPAMAVAAKNNRQTGPVAEMRIVFTGAGRFQTSMLQR